MKKAMALALPFIGLPPMLLGAYGLYMGTILEPPGGAILAAIGGLGVIIGSGLCIAVCAALRHAGKD